MNTANQTVTETGELNAFLIKKGYHAIPFTQNAVGHLLVELIVNGEKGLFILDTGAGNTIVDTKHASRLQLALQTDSTSFDGAGAGGQGLAVIPTEGNKLEIGTYILPDFPLCVMSLFEHVIETLAKAGVHEELSGVLGVDILKPGKAVIDYSGMVLYLLPGE
jgi:predicted aspartyl protease